MQRKDCMNKRKTLIIILFSLLFCKTNLFAEEFVVPTITSPYSIDNARFDSTGNYFSYEVANKSYIRNSQSLLLEDFFDKNQITQINPFVNMQNRKDYPATNINVKGKSITIETLENANSQISTKTISNLPVNIKKASTNKAQTYVAFIGEDNNCYVYDIASNSQISKIPCSKETSDLVLTNKNKILISDSPKSIGIYNFEGKKEKQFTSSSKINGFTLSNDEETLVTYNDNGIIDYYNTKSTKQIGYIPNFGSKQINDVTLSKDSNRLLITGKDNKLYIVKTKDVLYSENTIAPPSKQFTIDYKTKNPNAQKSGITEFLIDETLNNHIEKNPEYITSTFEQELESQKFKLSENNTTEPTVIGKQPEQANFPSSIKEKNKEYTFSNQPEKIFENKEITRNTQYPKDYPAPLNQEEDNKTEDNKIIETKIISKQNTVTTEQQENEDLSQNNELTNEEKKVLEKAEREAKKLAAAEDKKKEAEEKKAAKEAEKTAKQKEREEKQKNKLTLKEFFEQEDIKTYYKDGHGILADVGIKTQKKPYLFDLSLTTGYYNYDILQPFYFGGIISGSIGFPVSDFPYKYHTESETINNPVYVDLFFGIPIGFSIYPWKNSVELYAEIDNGLGLVKLWNGGFGQNSVAGKFYPIYELKVKIGVAWDFINLSLCGNYDIMKGVSFEIQLGCIINIGGTRTIGSLTQEKNDEIAK